MGKVRIPICCSKESNGIYLWKKYTILNEDKGDFIGYIISNDINEYPSNGIKDNNYYERISLSPRDFGGTKMISGSFIPSSDTDHYVAIHNFGTNPIVFFVALDASENVPKDYTQFDCGYILSKTYQGYASIKGDKSTLSTDWAGSSTVTTRLGLHAKYNYKANKKYNYLIIG